MQVATAIGISIAMLLAGGCYLAARQAKRDFHSLLHGDEAIQIRRLRITHYTSGRPSVLEITNFDDLQYLTTIFRHPVTNSAGQVYVFESELEFTDGKELSIILQMGDGACFIVSEDPFSLWNPVQFNLLLTEPIPEGIQSVRKALLNKR
ncbi:MAG TPA: hypothetical protein VN765_08675 [Candidatus Acidoferrum sp.]|nr:hypothetical protein [Candidatus Acidoferrum sp.]